ncbi:MAG: hypothetical protein MJ113_00185 [Lachnospiraceae bacterium]|nr:hypothetical protein [Lachnospiraceae bacterium]
MEYLDALYKAVATLAVLCEKNGFEYDMFTYSLDEQRKFMAEKYQIRI